MLNGASTASISLWVRVEPGSNVVNPSGVMIFGDLGGKFSATLSGTGLLVIRWSALNGSSASGSSASFTLAAGTSYHLAATWQDGSQRYYLNGDLARTDAQAGTLGVLGDTSAHPYRIGSDSAGTIVTLSEPTAWVGYALNATDVVNLRDRVTHPEGIAPASIALQWTLNGSDGSTVHPGEAGLADASASGLALSSIVGASPTYVGGVLSYVPQAVIGLSTIAPSGKSIVLRFDSGTSGTPTLLKSLRSCSDIQTIALSANPSNSAFRLGFAGQTTVPIGVTVLDPARYALATFPVTAGIPFELATTWGSQNFYATAVRYDVFDGPAGGVLLGSATLNQTTQGSSFSGELAGDNSPLPWTVLGTYTATGSTLTVRVTEPTGQIFVIDAFRVANVGAGTHVVYNDDDPAMTYLGFNDAVSGGRQYRGAYRFGFGSGSTSRHQVDPAAIQAALLALPNVQAGGLLVTSPSNSHDGPFAVQFIGPMRGVAQPVISCNDQAVSIAHDNIGGIAPTLSINGGAAIPLIDWAWGVGLPYGAGTTQQDPYLPFALAPLYQSPPASQFVKAAAGLFNYSGGGWGSFPAGYSGNAFSSSVSGDSANFPFEGLPVASYQVAVTWVASAGNSADAHVLVKDRAGNTLANVAVNQKLAPGDFNDQGVGWKIIGTFNTTLTNTLTVSFTPTGSSGGIVMADAVRLGRVGGDQSVVIGPNDAATLTIPAGWATTAAGAIAPGTLTLANHSGGSTLPTFVADQKTMAVGFNVEGDFLYNSILTYSNIAHRIQTPLNGAIASDASGYPTRINAPSIGQIPVGAPSPEYGGQGRGQANLPFGYYTILWDGASSVTCNQLGNYDATEVVGLRNITGTTNNRRVFNHQPRAGQQFSPNIYLQIDGTTPVGDGTYNCDVTNLRVYPPDPSDPTGLTPWINPPKWHPSLLAKLAGAQVLRFLDPLNINNNGIADFADLQPTTDLDYFSGRATETPIASITGNVSGSTYFDSVNVVVLEITTTAPHGIKEGVYVTLRGLGSPVVPLSDGTTYTLSDGTGWMAHVLSPTKLQIEVSPGPGSRTLTTPLGPGGVLRVNRGGGGMPFADCIDLCNQVGADLWLNIPTPATDACVTAMTGYVAAHLNAGRKVHVEYSNETWNLGFVQGFYCRNESKRRGGSYGDYTFGYVARAGEVHALAMAAFGAAGRSGDVIRTMAGQYGYVEYSTTSIAARATALGLPIDELALAPYYRNTSTIIGDEPTIEGIYDVLTPDQCLDLFEMFVQYGSADTQFAKHRPVLDAAGFTGTKLACYEGGVDTVVPGASRANYYSRSNAIVRHPRMYGIQQYHLQSIQDAGGRCYCVFYLGGVPGDFQWSTYFGWNQQPGTGNVLADAINASSPSSVDQVKTEVGGAIKRWAGLYPTTPKKTKIAISVPLSKKNKHGTSRPA